MSTTPAAHNAYVEQCQNPGYELPGTDLPWLLALRQAALSRFAASGFPSPREEEWKYTNVAPIEKHLFAPAPAAAAMIDSEWLARYRLPGAVCLVLVDGRLSAALSSQPELPEGVMIMGMADALAREPARVEAYLGRALGAENHGFLSFNTAGFRDGVFVYLASGQKLEQPIQIIQIGASPESLANTRNLIVAEPGSQARVVETYLGVEGTAYLTAAVTEVVVAEQAQLEFVKLQFESERAYHFGGVYVEQAPESVFRHHNFCFGALLGRNEIHSALETAADCSLNGLYLGSGRQHVDNHTHLNHLKPHGSSRELYKGILDQRARGVFQGRIVVHPDAQKIDAAMNNRNLLLSEHAEVDTKPQLEIYADDVKCAHGVTVGQLAQESVFYLQSRGIDVASARQMLTFAFANEMVEKLELEALKGVVQRELLARFPQSGIRKEWL